MGAPITASETSMVTTTQGTVATESLSGGAVVIPCYNAGRRVRGVVERALGVVGRVFVVDDGSTDGCVAALAGLPAAIIPFPANRGKGAAMIEGFRAALAIEEVSWVVVVDADGQHDASEIPTLYTALTAERADLVIGARTFDQNNVPWASRVGNKMTVRMIAWLFGMRIPDTQSGFRLYARRFLESVVADVPGGRYETEMAILIKAISEDRRLVSVPIRTIYEPANASSHFRKVRDSLRVYGTLFLAWRQARRTPMAHRL